jgi:hypothetical protein
MPIVKGKKDYKPDEKLRLELGVVKQNTLLK